MHSPFDFILFFHEELSDLSHRVAGNTMALSDLHYQYFTFVQEAELFRLHVITSQTFKNRFLIAHNDSKGPMTQNPL
jgi:hypothetical protein